MMRKLLREYVRSILLLETVSTEGEGLAIFTGEGFFDPQSIEAVLVNLAVFKELMTTRAKSDKFTALDIAKFAAEKSVVGYISLGPPIHGNAWGAWEVTRSAGPGYGKILYSIGYALSPSGLLMPDRVSVSPSARAAWKKASKKYDSLELDALPPENKTDTKEDDAELHDEEDNEYLDRAYIAKGTETGMINQLIAAGKDLETNLAKKFKGKTEQIIAAFHSAGLRHFAKHNNNNWEGPEA